VPGVVEPTGRPPLRETALPGIHLHPPRSVALTAVPHTGGEDEVLARSPAVGVRRFPALPPAGRCRSPAVGPRPAAFNEDSFDDLAVGAPYEDLRDFNRACGNFADHDNADAVHVIYDRGATTTPAGLTAASNQFLFQGGFNAIAQPRYQFAGQFIGASLTAWNFGKGANADLVIGVPEETLSTRSDIPLCPLDLPNLPMGSRRGAVGVLYSTTSKGFVQAFNLASSANEKWSLSASGCGALTGWKCIPNIPAELGDRFGNAVY
jgi:hypothetical protein